MLVAEQPARAAIFDALGIDYCCAGGRTLESACLDAAVDPEEVIVKLSEKQGEEKVWLGAGLRELADHIQQTHHAYLKIELPRIADLAEKVTRVHGLREPRLKELSALFNKFRDDLSSHTAREELALFPYIRKLDDGQLGKAPFGSVASPVRCMEREHDEAGAALSEMRRLTDNFSAPENACNSWKALLFALEALDHDLRIHVHKENSILFPGAIAREDELK